MCYITFFFPLCTVCTQHTRPSCKFKWCNAYYCYYRGEVLVTPLFSFEIYSISQLFHADAAAAAAIVNKKCHNEFTSVLVTRLA